LRADPCIGVRSVVPYWTIGWTSGRDAAILDEVGHDERRWEKEQAEDEVENEA
jgi:hypothetical protein